MSNDSLSTDSDSFIEVSSNMNFIIKVVLGSSENGSPETRRFRLREIVDDESETVSLENLVELLRKATGTTEGWAPQLSYEDSEGDDVAVTTTREFLDAVAQFPNAGTLKLVATNPCGQEGIKGSLGRSLKLITDSSVTDRLRAIMNTRDLDPVEYKDNLVDGGNKAVLTHLVDDFESHISASWAPPFVRQPTSDGRPVYHCNYTILGKVESSKYFAIDGLYLDLTKPCEDSLVEILFPRQVFAKFSTSVTSMTTGTQGHDWTVTTDELQLVTVKMDSENPPSFISLQEHFDDENRCTGAMVAKDEGLLADVVDSGDHGHLYKITGIFTDNWCLQSNGADWKAQLTLVGLRAFATHDTILEKNKVKNASVFGK